MGVICDRGRYYWVKRVPKIYAGLVLGADGAPVTQVRQALHTASRAEAVTKAAQIEALRMAEWAALAARDSGSARKLYERSREVAAFNGVDYRPLLALTEGPVAELLDRLRLLERGGPAAWLAQHGGTAPAARVTAEAVLGVHPEVLPDLREVASEYYALTRTRHLQKSEPQRRRWRLPRDRAIRNFIQVLAGAPPHLTEAQIDALPAPAVNAITREQALLFRAWWSTRVEAGMKIESANKDFGHLAEILGTWSDLTGVALQNPFLRLRLEGRDERHVPPFSRDWIAQRLLAAGALDRMNAEAADVLLVMINTGLRPSEITDAPPADFVTGAPIPFLRVAPNGRELKVAHTRRDIPLLGVSLDAARRIVARGGITRYRHKAGSWSAAVNKFLAANGLKETPAHVAYSLRHYVEDALLAAAVDDRVRADILGHKYPRPSYGDGGGLAGRRDALARIALLRSDAAPAAEAGDLATAP